LLTGADPKRPLKKRVMRTEAAFLLVAVPIENRPKQNMAGSRDHRRPHISDTGAHIRGPKANPRLLMHESARCRQENNRDRQCWAAKCQVQP
jgi:hypothetical protein